MNIFLDIETIPSQDPEVRARIAEGITAPGSYKKPETIAQWEADQKPELVKEAIAKTSFDGAYGHVCCIGWATDDNNVSITYADSVEKEVSTLASFVDRVERMVVGSKAFNPTIIGHNVCNFDIRFLWQRAIILGVRMPGWFPRDPKPWDMGIFDTMTAFAGVRGTISLDRLCQALGIPGKGDIDGSMVGQMWAEGRHDEIAEYCRADVERTRQIHRRMQIAFGEAA